MSKIAVFGGGCFWCIQSMYAALNGVSSSKAGYAGGKTKSPTYESVCSGNTGHAEVVKVEFDPSIITYKNILQIFFTIHDPTQLNRQGADVGTQYRSCIFYNDDEQKQIANEVIKEITNEGLYSNPIVTEVVELDGNYYDAEDYHQDYFEKSGSTNNYCRVVVGPKIAKFRKKYFAQLKK